MTTIDIQSISKTYGKQTVLSDIDLSWRAGQSIALIGPNGSGKTTLAKLILGLVYPDFGNILVDGKPITNGPAYREKIGYMPQISRFPEQMKVRQLFQLMQRIRPDVPAGRYDRSLYEELRIERMAHQTLGALSGGMKQQVSAALAFFFSPSILILDEPTAALDPVSNEILKARIRRAAEENKLILTTSHILTDLEEICNHVVYLLEGRVHCNASLADLRSQTSESSLNRIVVALLQNESNYATH